MQVFFGEVPSEFINSDDYFYNDGKYFYYKLDVGSEDVSIEDTCGRYLPIDGETIEILMAALDISLRRMKALAEVNKILDDSDQQILELTKIWNQQ